MDEAVLEPRAHENRGPDSQSKSAGARWIDLLWPLVIVASAGLITFLVLADIRVAIRPILALWFILVCPGMALVRLLAFESTVVEWTLAITVSIILGTAVTGVILYLAPWSPEGGLIALAAISVAGACAQLVSLRRRQSAATGAVS